MTLDAHILERPAPLSPAERARRIAAAEGWVCMLSALAEIGVRISAFLAHVVAPHKDRPDWPMMAFRFRGHPARAWVRVARGAGLAMALATRLGDEIAALRAGRPLDPPSPVAAARARKPREAATALKDRLHEIGLELGAEGPEPWGRAETLLENLKPDPRKDRRFCRLLNGPIKDAVAAICADLGLKPDWSLWTVDGFPTPPGGGEEAWIDFFAPDGEAGWTAKPARRPPPRDDPGGGPKAGRPGRTPPPDPAARRPPDRPGGA